MERSFSSSRVDWCPPWLLRRSGWVSILNVFLSLFWTGNRIRGLGGDQSQRDGLGARDHGGILAPTRSHTAIIHRRRYGRGGGGPGEPLLPHESRGPEHHLGRGGFLPRPQPPPLCRHLPEDTEIQQENSDAGTKKNGSTESHESVSVDITKRGEFEYEGCSVAIVLPHP